MKKNITSEDLKQIELNILCEFDKICSRENLRYYLCGGTLLGAVRHKGFIPWDDDIDVLMPRPDYNILLNTISSDCLPEYMEIQTWKNGKNQYPFIKIVDTRTHVQEKYLNTSFDAHVWIDIFPLDGNPSNDFKNKFLYKKVKFYRFLLTTGISRYGKGTTAFRTLVKAFFYPLALLLGNYNLCKLVDKASSRYDFGKCKFVGGVLWGYGPQERLCKDEYLPITKLEFEKHLFNAPSNYDTYLSNLYGNYMVLPPVENRIVHGFEAWWEEEEK